MPTSCDVRKRLALLVDHDNFSATCSGRGITLNAAALKERARTVGTVVWSAVFVDSSTLTPQERNHWFSNGFDIFDCPKLQGKQDRARKDSVDPAMIEKLNAIAEFLPVDEVLLASADRDFVRVVQRLRDAGKRVRIMTACPDDTPSLALCADASLAYKIADGETGVLQDAVAFLASGKRPDDAAVAQVIEHLASCIRVLDVHWNINRKRYGFMRVLQTLQAAPEITAAGLTADDVRRYLQFMLNQGIMSQERAAKGEKTSVTYYQVNRQHPLVKMARKGSDPFEPAEEAYRPPEPEPPDGESPGTHPRLVRFYDRLRKKDDIHVRARGQVPAGPDDARTGHVSISHDLRSQLEPLASTPPEDGDDKSR